MFFHKHMLTELDKRIRNIYRRLSDCFKGIELHSNSKDLWLGTCVWELMPPDKNRLRSIRLFNPSISAHKSANRPRYMQKRILRNGVTAYYWCVPWWAKRAGFALRNEPLGCSYEIAMLRTHQLNCYLDDWRAGQRFKCST